MKSWVAPKVPDLAERGIPVNEVPLFLRGTDGALASVTEGASLYVCGITPYDATHLGHAATYVAFDLLVRQWRDRGLDVSYVQNVTDVDDPLLERANSTGINWETLAQSQTDLYRTDMAALHVIPPTHFRGVVEDVELIAAAVADLMARGVAYPVGDATVPDIYFDSTVSNAVWHLGAISGLGAAEMASLFAERGGDPDRIGKRNPLDPLLWRGQRENEPFWRPDGVPPGRPGWHIECSAIAREFLPQPFTVQGGGSDLIFPHHEFSASHASLLTDQPFAAHYVHAGMVGFDGEKMSKSRGNLVFVSKLREAGVEPAVIRLALLAHHYRSDWFWTDAELTTSGDRLAKWRAAAPLVSESEARALVATIRERLAADLDAPGALEAVDAVAASASDRQRRVADEGEIGSNASGEELFRASIDALLGVNLGS